MSCFLSSYCRFLTLDTTDVLGPVILRYGGTVLCIVGHLEASLASVHYMPLWALANASFTCDNQKYLQQCAWVAQSIELLTRALGSGHDLIGQEIEPCVSLCAQRGICFTVLSLFPFFHMHALKRNLSLTLFLN